MELTFDVNRKWDRDAESAAGTRISVTINPQKSRDRRRSDAAERARRLLVSLRAYLMANLDESDESAGRGVLGRAKNLLIPRRSKNED